VTDDNQQQPVLVVTGAANGIGKATVARMAGAGWFVVGVDRDRAALEGALGGVDGTAVAGDVRDIEVLHEARLVAERNGRLRAWVNNAAMVRLAPLHVMEPAVIDEMLDIDLRAVVFGVREALGSFLGHGVPGAIVNVSSVHARGGFPGYGPYDTAKGGIEALTRYVCVEYGHLGVRCNAVAPGAVSTQFDARARLEVPGHPTFVSNAALLGPMLRTSQPPEIAEAIAFLIEGAPVSVNGHTLAVDNGMSARNYAFPPDDAVAFTTGAW
jgi:NAD(P)-dependent dehydrogenase (short-subunit alcohol dehydrogenase family)